MYLVAPDTDPQIPYTVFKTRVEKGEVSEIEVRGQEVSGRYRAEKEDRDDGEKDVRAEKSLYFTTVLPSFADPELIDLLEKNDVTIRARPDERSWFWTLVITLLPWVLIIGFFVMMNKKMRQHLGSAGGPFGFGKSKARRFREEEVQIRFDDVAGLENAKHELQEMVAYLKDPEKSVIVIAATNRPDVLDPALVRPGRFDRQITLDLPQKEARKEILLLHAGNVPLAGDVDMDIVAGATVGFSGADLKNLVNEAALIAAGKGKNQVEMEDFNDSRDKIIMGVKREDRDYSEATARVIDDEIKGILVESVEKARNIMKENRKKLDTLAEALIKKETLTFDEIRDLLRLEGEKS